MRPGVSSLRIGGGCALRSRGVVSPALALAAVGLVLATGAAARSAIAAPPSAGEAAPAFSLDTTAGATVTLGSLRGRLVVLHFWATWCGACRREMPLLQEIPRDHADDVTILGIDLGERAQKVSAYAKDADLTFPILLDPRGKVAGAYGVLGLPVTLLVGADGKIAGSVAMGSLTREGLEDLIAKHRPPPPPTAP